MNKLTEESIKQQEHAARTIAEALDILGYGEESKHFLALCDTVETLLRALQGAVKDLRRSAIGNSA